MLWVRVLPEETLSSQEKEVPFLCLSLWLITCAHTQANNLRNSLSVDPTDLKASLAAIQTLLMSSPIPASLKEAIAEKLAQPPFLDRFVAVRSSGTDEDSAAHSFAGECWKLQPYLICG